jgi:predicted DNA-binding protein
MTKEAKMRPKLLKAVNFYVTKKQIEQLKVLSRKTGLPVSEHVRRAIDEYLEKKKKKGG